MELQEKLYLLYSPGWHFVTLALHSAHSENLAEKSEHDQACQAAGYLPVHLVMFGQRLASLPTLVEDHRELPCSPHLVWNWRWQQAMKEFCLNSPVGG